MKDVSKFPQPKKRKLVITFDEEKRREYLTGFSRRKKERRAFGLAMQKVKDRRIKLEERKERREVKEEQMRELEKQKSAEVEDDEMTEDNKNKIYKRIVTEEKHLGNDVVVTTSYGFPADDESDSEIESRSLGIRTDEDQKRSGSVLHFMEEVKKSGVLSNKKSKKTGNPRKKGTHGASNMKGMGGAANLKVAKKSLLIAEKSRKKGVSVKKSNNQNNPAGRKSKRRRK